MPTGSDVFIYKPGIFGVGVDKKAQEKTTEIYARDDKNSLPELSELSSKDFYSYYHLALIHELKLGSSKLIDDDVATINVTFGLVEEIANKLPDGAADDLYKYLDLSPEELINCFKKFPKFTNKLSPKQLVIFAKSSPIIARVILLHPDLCKILDKNPEARFQIYNEYKDILFFADRVLTARDQPMGALEVQKVIKEKNSSPMSISPASPGTPTSLDSSSSSTSNVSTTELLSINTINSTQLIQKLNKHQDYQSINKILDDLLSIEQKSHRYKKELLVWNIYLLEMKKDKKDQDTKKIEGYRKELRLPVQPYPDGNYDTTKSDIQKEIKKIKKEIVKLQKQIDQKMIDLRELSEKKELGKRALDIFFKEDHAYQNLIYLLRISPRYRSLLDETHIEAMFACALQSSDGKDPNEKDKITINNSKVLSALIKYLAEDFDTGQCLINFIEKASKNNSPSRLEQTALDNIWKAVCDDSDLKILVSQEKEKGMQLISKYPDLMSALFENHPDKFAECLILPGNTEIVFNEDIQNALRRNANWITADHLIAINNKIQNNDYRDQWKKYLHKNDPSSKSSPLDKLRDWAKDIIINDVNVSTNSPEQNKQQQLLLENKLLQFLNKNSDVRGWIQLGFVINSDNKQPDLVSRWFSKNISDKNEVSRLIAIDDHFYLSFHNIQNAVNVNKTNIVHIRHDFEKNLRELKKENHSFEFIADIFDWFKYKAKNIASFKDTYIQMATAESVSQENAFFLAEKYWDKIKPHSKKTDDETIKYENKLIEKSPFFRAKLLNIPLIEAILFNYNPIQAANGNTQDLALQYQQKKYCDLLSNQTSELLMHEVIRSAYFSNKEDALITLAERFDPKQHGHATIGIPRFEKIFIQKLLDENNPTISPDLINYTKTKMMPRIPLDSLCKIAQKHGALKKAANNQIIQNLVDPEKISSQMIGKDSLDYIKTILNLSTIETLVKIAQNYENSNYNEAKDLKSEINKILLNKLIEDTANFEILNNTIGTVSASMAAAPNPSIRTTNKSKSKTVKGTVKNKKLKKVKQASIINLVDHYNPFVSMQSAAHSKAPTSTTPNSNDSLSYLVNKVLLLPDCDFSKLRKIAVRHSLLKEKAHEILVNKLDENFNIILSLDNKITSKQKTDAENNIKSFLLSAENSQQENIGDILIKASEGECELAVSLVAPDKSNLTALKIQGNSAFVVFEKKFYFINKKENQIIEYDLGNNLFQRIQAMIQTPPLDPLNNVSRKLSEEELSEIKTILSNNNYNPPVILNETRLLKFFDLIMRDNDLSEIKIAKEILQNQNNLKLRNTFLNILLNKKDDELYQFEKIIVLLASTINRPLFFAERIPYIIMLLNDNYPKFANEKEIRAELNKIILYISDTDKKYYEKLSGHALLGFLRDGDFRNAFRTNYFKSNTDIQDIILEKMLLDKDITPVDINYLIGHFDIENKNSVKLQVLKKIYFLQVKNKTSADKSSIEHLEDLFLQVLRLDYANSNIIQSAFANAFGEEKINSATKEVEFILEKLIDSDKTIAKDLKPLCENPEFLSKLMGDIIERQNKVVVKMLKLGLINDGILSKDNNDLETALFRILNINSKYLNEILESQNALNFLTTTKNEVVNLAYQRLKSNPQSPQKIKSFNPQQEEEAIDIEIASDDDEDEVDKSVNQQPFKSRPRSLSAGDARKINLGFTSLQSKSTDKRPQQQQHASLDKKLEQQPSQPGCYKHN